MINLMLGDCLERMKEIPDKSVDMVLTDPPYGTTACKWDSVIPFEPMWAELKRITKDNAAICLFGAEPFSTKLRESNLNEFRYDWIWEKNRAGSIGVAKTQPLRYHEIISVFYKNKANYYPQLIPRSPGGQSRVESGSGKVSVSKFRQGTNATTCEYAYSFDKYDKNLKSPSSILKFNKEGRPQDGVHPTQKPVLLLEYLIKTYTLEGETVLDFTMGSGSTGVAAKNLGRKFIGIERDEKYFEIAKQRIEGAELSKAS